MKTLISLLIVGVVAGCAPESAPVEPGPVTTDPTVTLEDRSFSPAAVTVEPGTTVTWEWDDGDTPHDVRADEFQSEVVSSGTYTHTFEETGTYEYVCSLHSNMKGTVFAVDPDA